MRDLSDDELERYARHIVLPEVGGLGQRRLASAAVLVVGAGGLGSPCLQYLAAAGVGRLGVVDDDCVALSNLQRQVLHGEGDVGRPKVESARDSLKRLNSRLELDLLQMRVGPENAAELIAGYDVVADGSDNFATRLAVADAALARRVPLISAAVGRFEGQVATFCGWAAGAPCYRCLVGRMSDVEGATCAEQGVLGALTGIVGAVQALEVIREVVGFGNPLAGRLLTLDVLTWRTRLLTVRKDPDCPACAHPPAAPPL